MIQPQYRPNKDPTSLAQNTTLYMHENTGSQQTTKINFLSTFLFPSLTATTLTTSPTDDGTGDAAASHCNPAEATVETHLLGQASILPTSPNFAPMDSIVSFPSPKFSKQPNINYD
jgi:hypothetical protein